MPSMQDKIDLITWVEALPRQENVTGFDAVLALCAERYGNKGTDLEMILDCYTDLFRKSMEKQIKAHRKAQELGPCEMPHPDMLKEMFDKSLHAVLLRMWTYASEHYQRYQAVNVFQPLDDTDIAALFSAPNEDPPNEG